MPRGQRMIPKGGAVVETCTRTVHGRALLRPGFDANERIIGCLGRAADYYKVQLFNFSFSSNHAHLQYWVDHSLQMSRFQGHFNSSLARELGRLHDWREKFWGRRFRPMIVSNEPEVQRARLKYVLAQHVEAGLIERVNDWPGPNSAGALARGEVLEGTWFNRTKEWHARRRNESFAKYDYATTYEIELQPMPCFRHLSPEEYREMIADLIREIEEEGAAGRKERSFPVLGARRILAEHPHKVVGGGGLSAAPVLFAGSWATRVSMKADYKAFVTAYQSASERLLAAAQNGGRIKLGFPQGSSPPVALSELLSGGLDGVFNPELEFPPRSFPRPWPFIGGTLPPPPPTPPTRRLVYQAEETAAAEASAWVIIDRGEIPTVYVPRRAEPMPPEQALMPPEQVSPPARGVESSEMPSRDPPA